MTDFRALCKELATLAKREHYCCEDSWYSCPKAEDKCANESKEEDCDCGADIHNAKVEAIAALAKYGTPTSQPPAALAEQPVSQPCELPEIDAKGPTDEEIMEMMPQQMRDDLAVAARALVRFHQVSDLKSRSIYRIILNRHAVDHARAVLAKWGHQRLATSALCA